MRGAGRLVATWLAACMAAGSGAASVRAQDGGPPSGSLGADTPFFQEDFAQSGPFGEKSDARGTLAVEDGAFTISLIQDDAPLWTWASFTVKDVAWLVEVDLTLEAGTGAGGLMCGSDADSDDFLVGAVNGAAEWGIGHIHDDQIEFLTGGPLPVPVAADGTIRLGLECAVTGEEADHVRLWADGEMLGDLEAAPRLGPFDNVGLYAEAPQAPGTARFDDLAMRYGEAYAPAALSTLGATAPAVADDFSVEGGWAMPTTDVGSVSYEDEALRFGLTEPDGHLWSFRDLTKETPVLRVEATVGLQGSVAAGPMCGPVFAADPRAPGPATTPTADPPDFYVGLVNSDGQWRIDRLVGEAEVRSIANGALPEGVDVAGQPFTVALECAATTGGDRIAIWVNGTFVGATSARPTLAPFLLVGAYGRSGVAPGAAIVDDLRIFVGPAYAPVSAP